MVLFFCLNNRLPAQYRFSAPADRIFTEAHQSNKSDRFNLVDFKDFTQLRSNDLKKAVTELNEELRRSGEVFVQRRSKKNPQKFRQACGFVRVEVIQPGDEYREAKLKIYVSDDYRIQNPNQGLHPDALKTFEFKTGNFDKVQIMNFADHKIKTPEVYYPQGDQYTPGDEQFYAPISSAKDKGPSTSSGFEFDGLYEDLPYFDTDS